MNDLMRKSVSASETSDKMNSYFKKQANTPRNMQKEPSESNLYNFSEVTEQQKEDNEEDLNIMSVFEKGVDVSNSPLRDKKDKKKARPASGKAPAPAPKRPVSVKRPHQFNKLGDSEKEKVFLTVYDENLKIKEQQRAQELYYSQLEVKFTTLDKQMKSFKGTMAPSGKHHDTAKPTTINYEKDEQVQLLKYQNTLKDQENEKLKQKLLALSQAHMIVKSSKAPHRRIVTTVNAGDPLENRKGDKSTDAQTKDLLKLNDMIKKRCLEQESQIRSMQAMMNSKMVSNKDLTDKNATFVTLKERYEKMESHLGAQRNQLEDERKRQAEIMHLLRDEREKNHLLEQQVRSMELMTKSAQDLNADLVESKRQKYELEEKLKILMESPFFKDYNERATVTAKMRSMENDLKLNSLENRSLKDTNARLETENQIRRQENTEANTELKKKYEECKEYQMQLNERDKQLAPFKDLNYWDNDQFLKVLGNLKWTGEDPAWRKIEFIDRTYLDSDDPNVLRKEIEHLKLEKGELAAHLEKTQILLKTRQDIEMQKEMIHKTEIDKLSLQLKAAVGKCSELAKISDLHYQSKQQRTMYEAEGVKYSDSVSVFSVDPQEEDQLQPGENFFDLFLGDADLDQSGLMLTYAQLHPSGGPLDPSALLTFITIDFYDHETQHTTIAEGQRCQFNLQVSFKVVGDGPFISYLESGFLKVELYMSQGSEAIKLATGLLSLRDLVISNKSEISKVLAGTITLNGSNNQQFVGLVSFKARMRQPISQIIKWMKDQKELDIQEHEEIADIVAIRRRKLVVVIDKASQLPARASSFVYYSMDNKDFNTNTQLGATPRWEYRQVHEIQFNEEFANNLKRNHLELFLIDDNQPLTADGNSDKLGLCSIDLSPLLNGEIIDIAKEIKNDLNQAVGRLYVKVFWYENDREDDRHKFGQGIIQQSWEDSITSKIAAEARSRGITSRQTFRVFDFDNDLIISYEDFQNGLRNILGIKLNQAEVQLYYQKLPQPLNQQAFDSIFRRIIGIEDNNSIMSNINNINNINNPELSQINQMVNYNSQQLMISQDRLYQVKKMITDVIQLKMRKGKTRNEIFNEIDSVRPDGLITVLELHKWLRYCGVDIPEEDAQQFLSNYMDQDHDNRINLKEFFDFILGERNDNRNDRNDRNDRNYGNDRSDRNYGNDRNDRNDSPQLRNLNNVNQKQMLFGRQTSSDRQYDIVNQALDTILQFAQEHSLTLMKVREIMDDNRNGFVERQEMKVFLQSCKLFFEERDLDKIIDFFDTNRDNLISVQEFADALSLQNKNKKLLKNDYSTAHVSDHVVEYLMSYMKKQKKSMADLFNDIDENGDGYLSRAEMRNIFKKKIIVVLDSEEFETFFLQFDQDHDDKISIKEFVTIMQPALKRFDIQSGQQILMTQTMKQSVNINQRQSIMMKTSIHDKQTMLLSTNDKNSILQLQKKTQEIISQHTKALLVAFTKKEENRYPGCVTLANFRLVLSSLNYGFTNNDIDRLTNEFTEKNQVGLISYAKFIDLQRVKPLGDLFDQTSVSGFGSMSQLDQERATIKTREIFDKISKVIERQKIPVKKVFATFDQDGDGKITKKEMGTVFNSMRLKTTPAELDMIFATLDKNNDNFILINKLLDWLEIKK